jgi:hypothetical protein
MALSRSPSVDGVIGRPGMCPGNSQPVAVGDPTPRWLRPLTARSRTAAASGPGTGTLWQAVHVTGIPRSLNPHGEPQGTYKLDVVLIATHTGYVIVDWTDEFDRWLTHAEEQGGRLLAVATALLKELNDLPAKPAEESATFKRVRQARRHEIWRVAHPFDPEVAVRIICWFPSDEEVVIALVGFDKKAIGDVFYASAAAWGEALVDALLRQKGSTDGRGS